MKLALYKGPATGIMPSLAHWAIKTFTSSQYSHCEIALSTGMCCSSSGWDGGVRIKAIDLTNGRWDVIDIAGDEGLALSWFEARIGMPYDYAGAYGFAVPFLHSSTDKYFCSEACAEALGLPDPRSWTPGDLYRYFKGD